jgi:UDP-N-acetylmuramate-alanine ligase
MVSFHRAKNNIHHLSKLSKAWMSVASGEVQAANKFLADLQKAKPSIDLGLQVSRDVLAKMGDPHHATRVVHVAGTNGKGSVCAMISSALQRAGLKVGTYTSPHIRHWSDAVAINGKSDRDGWARAVSHVETAVGGSEKAAGRLTAFEAATAAMWSQMKHANVDIAVVETGVGGRLDATNVCAQSEVSVITNIGLDHQVGTLAPPSIFLFVATPPFLFVELACCKIVHVAARRLCRCVCVRHASMILSMVFPGLFLAMAE